MALMAEWISSVDFPQPRSFVTSRNTTQSYGKCFVNAWPSIYHQISFLFTHPRGEIQRSSIRPRNDPVTWSPLIPSVSTAILYFEEREVGFQILEERV
jgi:hypothetical protein